MRALLLAACSTFTVMISAFCTFVTLASQDYRRVMLVSLISAGLTVVIAILGLRFAKHLLVKGYLCLLVLMALATAATWIPRLR